MSRKLEVVVHSVLSHPLVPLRGFFVLLYMLIESFLKMCGVVIIVAMGNFYSNKCPVALKALN